MRTIDPDSASQVRRKSCFASAIAPEPDPVQSWWQLLAMPSFLVWSDWQPLALPEAPVAHRSGRGARRRSDLPLEPPAGRRLAGSLVRLRGAPQALRIRRIAVVRARRPRRRPSPRAAGYLAAAVRFRPAGRRPAVAERSAPGALPRGFPRPAPAAAAAGGDAALLPLQRHQADRADQADGRTAGPAPRPRRSSPGIHRLPTWAELAAVSEEELRACLLGFRARYVQQTAQLLARTAGLAGAGRNSCRMPRPRSGCANCRAWAKKWPTACCCSAPGRLEAFPVDVWIIKTMETALWAGGLDAAADRPFRPGAFRARRRPGPAIPVCLGTPLREAEGGIRPPGRLTSQPAGLRRRTPAVWRECLTSHCAGLRLFHQPPRKKADGMARPRRRRSSPAGRSGRTWMVLQSVFFS